MEELETEDLRVVYERSKILNKKIANLQNEYAEEVGLLRDSNGNIKSTHGKLTQIVNKGKALGDALKEFRENDEQFRLLFEKKVVIVDYEPPN